MSKANIGSAAESLLTHDKFDKLKSSVSIGGGTTGIGISANTCPILSR